MYFESYYLIKLSIVIPRSFSIFSIVWIDGFVITLDSNFVRVVYGTSDFRASASWVMPSFDLRTLTLSPIVVLLLSILWYHTNDRVIIWHVDNSIAYLKIWMPQVVEVFAKNRQKVLRNTSFSLCSRNITERIIYLSQVYSNILQNKKFSFHIYF